MKKNYSDIEIVSTVDSSLNVAAGGEVVVLRKLDDGISYVKNPATKKIFFMNTANIVEKAVVSKSKNNKNQTKLF